MASFLKRQRFLSRLVNRPKDVGKPKAEVAAARIMERVAGVSVTPHFCRIEDKPVDWYRDFHVIALGLDSLEVRIVPRARLAEKFLTPCNLAPTGAQLHQRRRLQLPGCALRDAHTTPSAWRIDTALITVVTEFEEDGTPDLSTVKPMVDGGTEGFKVRARKLAMFLPTLSCHC